MNTLQYEDSEVYDSLRRLEHVLNNRTETFTNKVESLIEVWKLVQDCRLTEHKQYVMHLMDWLKLHTLNIVLTGDWKKYKDVYEERLLKEVKHCEMLLLHSNNIFSFRCKKLAEVIKDPWGSPILGRLLNTPDLEIGPEEMEFFGMETGYLISTRLRKLCESHCEDLALNLVTAFMRFHQMAEVQQFTINATEDQKRFILDVYIALLYKYKRTHLIISTLKSLTLTEGLDLLKRFAHKRVNISKIWRHSGRIAYLAAQVYMTAAVMKIPSDGVRILEGLLDTWLDMPETVEDLVTLTATVRRIMQAADSPVHMYIFCKAFYKRFGGEMRTFIIELYIMALTTDINVLQRQKEEFNEAEERESSERLAYGFLKLADVLDQNLKLSRESVLTAFSLKPSQAILDRIVSLAKATSYDVIPPAHLWKCDHPPSDSSDDVSYKCNKCGEYKSYLELQSSLNSNTTLSDAVSEELDLSPHLRDDLVVVLSSPRYHFLNWLGTWKNLYHLCVIYLSDPVKTKNIITELKYVDIDYSLFVGIKREPEDENANGIERGYEHYLEDNYLEAGVSSDEHLSQDNCANEMASGNFHLLPPPATKSDPKVLKSLRLFRPNLKRSKPNQHDQMPPSKVFIPSPYFTPPHSFSPNPFHVPHATSNLGLSNYNNVFTQAASLPHLTNPQVSHNGKHAYQPSHNPITLQDLQLQAILAAGYEQTVRNPLQKDVVLNLSIKDPPTLPMDLSKTNLKENLSEIHINDVSTAGNNHMRNKPVTMTHKKIVASNTPKVKISSAKQENNINKLIRPSVNNNTLTHQDYSYSTPTSSNYDDLVLRNSKNAGPSMQVFKNKNINYDRNISKNVCTPTNTPSSSPKNSPVKKRSVKQHSSSGKSPSKSLHSAMEYSVARKIPRTFSVHSSSEENANGINFTNPNSAQHIPLMKYLNNKPGFSKKSNELRSNTEAILHEEMKALRRATQSNATTSPSVIDPLNSEEFQITLESLLEVKKNPVLMALEEKRRSLEQYKLLFDDFNCGDPFEPHSSRYHSSTSDRMSEDCALGEDDDKWFSVYNSDEGSTSHVNEPIGVSHLSYSPPQFFYTSSTTTNSINNSDTILIESSPENSCDKECHTQNNGRLTHYDVENFATKTEEVLNVSAENMSDSDRCGPDFNICQKLFEESEESSPSQEQDTEEIIELSSSQQQETTKVSPTHTNSQLEDVSSPLLHGAVEPIINIDTFPDTPKKHNLSAYGLPFEVSKENIRSHANTSVEERMAVYRASLAVPKPYSSFNQDNRNFPINSQSNSEVIAINSTQATCSTKVLYINSQGCSSKNERVSSSTSSPVGSQGSNSEYEINSHVEMQSRSNSSNRNSLYGQDNSDEERNSSNDSLDSKLSEEKDTATDSDNRSISNDKCYRNTHNSNSSRDSVDTKASVEKDHVTISDSESSSTNGKKSPINSSRDSQQTNTSEDNASRTNSNSDVENSPSQDSSTNDSNSYHETQSSKDSQGSNSVNENLETNSHDSNIDDEGNSSRGFQETDLSEQKNVSTSSRDIKSADGRMSNAATESAPNTLNSTSDGENVPSSQCSSCDKARDSSMDVEVGNSFEERHSLLHSEESWSKLDDTRKVFEYFPSSPRLSMSYSRYDRDKYASNCSHSSINSAGNVEEPYTAARAMCLDKPFGVSQYVPKGYFGDKKENIKFKQTQDPAKNDSMCLGIQHNKKKTDSSITSIVKRSLELKCPPTCHIHYRIKEKEPLTLKKCDDSTLTIPFSDTVSITDKKLSKNSDHDSSRHSFSEESNSQQSIEDSNGYEGSNNKKDSSVTSNGSLTCKAWPGVKVRSLDLEDLFLIRKGSVNNSERKLSTSSAELSASPAESVKDASLWKASNKRKLNKHIRHKRWETLSSSSEDERLCKINSSCNKSMNCISNEKESRVETLSPSSCSSDNTPCDNKKLKDERKIPNWCQILKNLPFVNSIQNFDDNFINFCGDDIKRYKSKHPDNAKNYSDLTNNFDEPCSSSESSESFNKRSNWRSTNYRKKKVSKSHPTIKETTKSLQTSLRKSGKVQEKNKNEYDLIKKYKLKDVRVVLYPLTYPDPKQDGIKHKEARCSKQKSKSGLKKIMKKSENLTKEKCRSKNGIAVGNSESKPWPLQDISPKVNRYKDAKNNIEPQEKPDVNLKTGINVMNPRVVLKRLEFDKDKRRSASSVLAQVPGLNDLQMIRPSSVDRIVQVVQVPGARSVNNIPIPNTQTSTQITPHIQRIGQPRTEKPLPSDSEMVVATTTATPSLTTSNTTTESPTLINILSQQVVRPGNQNNCVNTKPRTSPLINILSQQIIKPAATVTNSKVTSSPSTTEMQVNSIPRVISGGDQIINQLINQVRTPAPTLKTLVSSPGTDQNRIVQFICKSSDGKLIPVTSFTSNKVVKVSMAQTANASVSGTVATEENSGKVAQNTFKVKSETSEGSDTLPKFQQAFGKPTYQNNVEASESTGSNNETINSETEKPTNLKNQPKTRLLP
ncbi:hypothetical protein RI129_011808 [Pyrocoelia pectoralis]|uniref:Uncharacterized protein n=1 Tax=Pyrocoelia pectoralis TaxID=417401 RepID=A0AAN7V6E9_9COLE